MYWYLPQGVMNVMLKKQEEDRASTTKATQKKATQKKATQKKATQKVRPIRRTPGVPTARVPPTTCPSTHPPLVQLPSYPLSNVPPTPCPMSQELKKKTDNETPKLKRMHSQSDEDADEGWGPKRPPPPKTLNKRRTYLGKPDTDLDYDQIPPRRGLVHKLLGAKQAEDPTTDNLIVSQSKLVQQPGIVLLHQGAFKTLYPHQWLHYEVLEYYLNLVIKARNTALRNRVCYINGFLMTQLWYDEGRPRSLLHMDMDQYDWAVSFIHISRNHWVFVFLDASKNLVYFVDPKLNLQELQQSKDLAAILTSFFAMRQTVLAPRRKEGNRTWAEIAWQGAVVSHNHQPGNNNCGVYTMKFAEQWIDSLPLQPTHLHLEAKKTTLALCRTRLALKIEKSGDNDLCCACANEHFGNGQEVTSWVECSTCQRWYHQKCTSFVRAAKWRCLLCKLQK